ncbi:MAG TPA: hypothetical protein VGC96_12820 [Candidatus Elarobacter sp.]|jgi:hypothetical protein
METHAPLTYSLDFSTGTVELALTDRRFTVTTQGKGLIDKPRTIDVALSDLAQFCVVPTIRAQNVVGQDAGTSMIYDAAYDAELIFSYRDAGKVKKKRLFVNRRDDAFQALLAQLKDDCPTASLLNLDPAEAQKQIGVVSGSKALVIVIGVIVGVPLVIGLIVLLTRSHG